MGLLVLLALGAGFKPDVLDLSLVDDVVTVSNDEAVEYARRLHKEEGITGGISCGAAVRGSRPASGSQTAPR